MNGQRSYNPQCGRGLYRPMPPPYQQHPFGPPHFQQGLPSPAIYQHRHTALPQQIHQASSQSYVHSSLPVHGSIPVSHVYPTPQLNTQNPHLRPRPMPHPPGISHEEVFQPSLLPQPLPPAPSHSQGQTTYRAPLHPPPQQSGVLNALQHPLPSLMSNSAPFTSTVHLTGGNPHAPSLAPLQPPPPSPCIQPPPPPSTLPTSTPSTTKPTFFALNLLCLPNNDFHSSELSINNSMPSLPATYEVIASNQGRPNLLADDDFLNQGGGSSIEVSVLPGDGLSLKGSLLFDKLDTEKSNSPMWPLENEPSALPCHFVVASMSNSPADSDMEMEGLLLCSYYLYYNFKSMKERIERVY